MESVTAVKTDRLRPGEHCIKFLKVVKVQLALYCLLFCCFLVSFSGELLEQDLTNQCRTISEQLDV